MATGGILLNGSTQYLELSSAVVTSFPCTLVIWVESPYNGNPQVWLSQSDSDGDRHILSWIESNSTTKYASYRVPGNGSLAMKFTSPNPSAGTLQLAMAVFTSTTSRQVFFGDNTGSTVDTASLADELSSHDRTVIGALHYNSNSPQHFCNGVVAEAHLFNVALTASDFTTLLTTPPEQVSGWVDGWKLASASDLTSIGGTRTLTAVGSPLDGNLELPYTRSGGGGPAPSYYLGSDSYM